MLTVEDINLYYGASHILRDVIARRPDGRRSPACSGRNGVGKTSLLVPSCGLQPIARRHDHLGGRGHHRPAAA